MWLKQHELQIYPHIHKAPFQDPTWGLCNAFTRSHVFENVREKIEFYFLKRDLWSYVV